MSFDEIAVDQMQEGNVPDIQNVAVCTGPRDPFESENKIQHHQQPKNLHSLGNFEPAFSNVDVINNAGENPQTRLCT